MGGEGESVVVFVVAEGVERGVGGMKRCLRDRDEGREVSAWWMKAGGGGKKRGKRRTSQAKTHPAVPSSSSRLP